MTSETNSLKDAYYDTNSKLKGAPFKVPHLPIALLISIVALALYMTTIVGNSIPGEPASLLFNIVREDGNIIARHLVWRKLILAVAAIGGSGLILTVNIFNAIVSAIGIGMSYLTASSLISLMLDRETLDAAAPRHGVQEGERHAEYICVIGGAITAATLAFCPPYWFTATQAYFHSFYLLWLMTAIWLLLRFAATARTSLLLGFAFLYAAGLSQTSCFLAFAPLCYGFALYAAWSRSKLTLSTILAFLGASLAGISLLFINAWEFYGSPVCELADLDTYWAVLVHLARGIFFSVFASMPRTGWMIYIGTTIAPCLAILLTAPKAINGERDWSFFVLNAFIFVASFLVVCNFENVTPWQLFGIGAIQLVPYAMMAFSFGYIAAYLSSLSFHFITNSRRRSFTVRTVTTVLFAGICVFAFANNYSEVNHKKMDFVGMYADTLLDNLEGRKWVVTNGAFDDVIGLRARERGMEVHLINFARSRDRISAETLKRSLPTMRLQNTAAIGFDVLLQEWIGSTPGAQENLALCLLPDLWSLGGYEVYPKGLAFHGVKKEQLPEILEQDLKGDYLRMLDKFEAVFGKVEVVPGTPHTMYKRAIAAQISFIGNNCGYLLEINDLKDEAFEIYSRVYAFDPENISALLNCAAMVQAGFGEEVKDKVLQDLTDFSSNLRKPIDIWALSRTYGYVSSPEIFAKIGWSWALSGQNSLALRALSTAVKDIKPERRAGIQALMAGIHMLNNDVQESEDLYNELVTEDSGNKAALIGLFRINAMRGDVDKANHYFEMCQKAGIPMQDLIYEKIVMNIAVDDIPQARILAGELVAMAPAYPKSYISLFAIHQTLYATAKTLEETEAAQQGMEDAVTELERVSSPDDFHVLFLKGTVNSTLGKYADARNYFNASLERLRGPNVLMVLERIISLDFALGDKSAAAAHARLILGRDRNHAFANYIMGALELDKRNFDSAEDYLSHSYKANPKSILAINDLAMVKLRLKKYDEGEMLIREAFEINDQLYAAWDTLGEILYAKAQYEKARDAFEVAVRLNTDNSDMRVPLHLAAALNKLGDNDRCRALMAAISAKADDLTGEDRTMYDELNSIIRARAR